jgi:hypothetical protein
MTPQKRRAFILTLLVGFTVPIGIAIAIRLAPSIGVALLIALLVVVLGSNMVIAVMRARRKQR